MKRDPLSHTRTLPDRLGAVRMFTEDQVLLLGVHRDLKSCPHLGKGLFAWVRNPLLASASAEEEHVAVANGAAEKE